MLKSVLLACIVCAHCDVRRNGQTPWTRQLPDGVKSSKSDTGSCADHLLHQGHWAHSGSSERHLDTGWSWKAPRREADGCELLGPHAARQALRGRWVVVVGDSVARFLYSALLALVNGTDPAPGWPTHRVGEGTCMARVVANGNPNPNPNPNPNLNPNPNHNPNPNPNIRYAAAVRLLQPRLQAAVEGRVHRRRRGARQQRGLRSRLSRRGVEGHPAHLCVAEHAARIHALQDAPKARGPGGWSGWPRARPARCLHWCP